MADFNTIKLKFGIKADRDQERAICHKDGPALVLAGPGSGKTTVIVSRAIFLLETMENLNESVLTVAFNKAASLEMNERFIRLYKRPDEKVHFSTFHSFCNKVICTYEKLNGVAYQRIIEGSNTGNYDKFKIVGGIYKEVNGIRLSDIEVNKLINEISCIKNGLPVETAKSGSAFKALDKITQRYEEFKKEHNLIDYDDMLYFSKYILDNCPEILEKIHRRYKYVQVDEGQDLSEIQMKILQLVAKPDERNVFIVGDDDQGIYGFRGAKPECILNIEEFFTRCKIYRLERNYRSTKNIVDLAGKFIGKNEKRYIKKHYTNNATGPKPVCRLFYNDRELFEYIYARIFRKNSGTCGILFRNGLSAILPAVFLLNRKVEFCVSKLRDSFFDHWMIHDIINLLKELKKSGNKSSPGKYLKSLLEDKDYMEKAKMKSELLFQPVETLDRLMQAIIFLAEKTKSWDEVIMKFKTLEKIFKEQNNNRAKVQLSTVHASKGLEYDSVFLIDLYKGEFPGKNSDYELEEERRLFFVGMTRAKSNLYILCPSKRAGKNLEAGQFFMEVKALLA